FSQGKVTPGKRGRGLTQASEAKPWLEDVSCECSLPDFSRPLAEEKGRKDKAAILACDRRDETAFLPLRSRRQKNEQHESEKKNPSDAAMAPLRCLKHTPRSGLAVNHFIDVGAGVIDEDYRGNVGVVLFNFGKEPFKVKKGDRIAQLICERIYYPVLEEVKVLDETERGSGGFGSTGQK
ncbi:hypothetical protein E2320_013413, partial [Naja naja]